MCVFYVHWFHSTSSSSSSARRTTLPIYNKQQASRCIFHHNIVNTSRDTATFDIQLTMYYIIDHKRQK